MRVSPMVSSRSPYGTVSFEESLSGRFASEGQELGRAAEHLRADASAGSWEQVPVSPRDVLAVSVNLIPCSKTCLNSSVRTGAVSSRP